MKKQISVNNFKQSYTCKSIFSSNSANNKIPPAEKITAIIADETSVTKAAASGNPKTFTLRYLPIKFAVSAAATMFACRNTEKMPVVGTKIYSTVSADANAKITANPNELPRGTVSAAKIIEEIVIHNSNFMSRNITKNWLYPQNSGNVKRNVR